MALIERASTFDLGHVQDPDPQPESGLVKPSAIDRFRNLGELVAEQCGENKETPWKIAMGTWSGLSHSVVAALYRNIDGMRGSLLLLRVESFAVGDVLEDDYSLQSRRSSLNVRQLTLMGEGPGSQSWVDSMGELTLMALSGVPFSERAAPVLDWPMPPVTPQPPEVL